MQWLVRIAFLSVLLLSACNPFSLERKLLGKWSGCSVDICSVTTLRPDHTFSERFVGFDTDSYSGTWRVERDQLVLHITWVDENLKDMLGKDMRLIISDLQSDKLMATLAEDKRKALPWKRVQ
jgi:hypothetical protein